MAHPVHIVYIIIIIIYPCYYFLLSPRVVEKHAHAKAPYSIVELPSRYIHTYIHFP